MPPRKKRIGATQAQISELADQKRKASFAKPRRVESRVGQTRMLQCISSAKLRNGSIVAPTSEIVAQSRSIEKHAKHRVQACDALKRRIGKLEQLLQAHNEHMHRNVPRIRKGKCAKNQKAVLKNCDKKLSKFLEQLGAIKKMACDDARDVAETDTRSATRVQESLKKVVGSFEASEQQHDSAIGSWMDINFEANSAHGGQPSDVPIIAKRNGATDAFGVVNFSPFTVNDPYLTIEDIQALSQKRRR